MPNDKHTLKLEPVVLLLAALIVVCLIVLSIGVGKAVMGGWLMHAGYATLGLTAVVVAAVYYILIRILVLLLKK